MGRASWAPGVRREVHAEGRAEAAAPGRLAISLGHFFEVQSLLPEISLLLPTSPSSCPSRAQAGPEDQRCFPPACPHACPHACACPRPAPAAGIFMGNLG